MSPQIGQPAPDFDLPATTGERISLSSLRGNKVVVMFYPFSFTGICTGELCDIRDRWAVPQDDAVVLAISCDPGPSQKAFAAAENFAIPLLSDFWPHGETARAYGVFLEQVGAANRGTFVIDREGILRWSVVTELGVARNSEEYAAALAEID